MILFNYGHTTDFKSVLGRGCQMGSQVGLSVLEAQLVSDTLPVGLYRSRGQPQQFCHLFGIFPLPDELGHLQLRRGKAKVSRGEPLRER